MKLTNKMNLAQPLVDAVKNDVYSKGDAWMSVTSLLRPPRVAALEALHEDEIEEDASDRIWSLCGQVIHGILERADTTGIAERRLWVEIEGMKISGAMDRYLDGALEDYKFVTAYKFKGGQVPDEYEQQMNLYAHMLRENGHPVTSLRIIGILRDWSKLEAQRSPDYPQKQVVSLPVPLWSPEKAREFMRERVILHKQARVSLPECSVSERWARPTVYAVMKPGRKTALKLYDSEALANAHAELEPGLYVQHRPGMNVRCESYCAVSKFCTFFQALKQPVEAEEVS